MTMQLSLCSNGQKNSGIARVFTVDLCGFNKGITCVVVTDISIQRIVDDYIAGMHENGGLNRVATWEYIAKLCMYTTDNGNDVSRLMEAGDKVQWCYPTT